MNDFKRTSSIAVLTLLVSGCIATEPPVALQQADVPAGYEQPVSKDAPIWPKAEWWKGFGSSELDTVIADAEANNLTLASAVAAVTQARAQARVTDSVLFPSIGATGSAGRTGTKTGGISTTYNSFGLSGSASYEASFWNTVPGVIGAAESLKAAGYNRETVALTITASVANTYLDVLALREREAIAKKNIEAAGRILTITQAKVTNGVASQLDLAQQEALVNGEKAAVPALEEQANEARFGLAILLAHPPEGFTVAGTTLDGIAPPDVQPGLPSELLARRPDVAYAEAQLAAAHANVDAARNAFFPQINLTASGGYSSTQLSNLINPSSLGFSLGAQVLQSIFSGGRLSGEVEISKAQQLQLVEAYRSAVLNAFKDVETSLSQVSHYTDQLKYQAAQEKAAAEAFRISEIQYREGVADLLTVLTAQQTLFSAQDALVQVRLARLQASINLYKALGGGWSQNPDERTQPAATPTALPKGEPAVKAAKKTDENVKNPDPWDWLF